MNTAEIQAHDPVKLAVFDFDGTCLDGSSTVRLVGDLLFSRKLGIGTGLKIGIWGLKYKLHLPQDESWVRAKVWKPFIGHPAPDVDLWLRDYYDRVVERIWRSGASEAIAKHQKQGLTVMIVSASFEPIVMQACSRHGIEHQVSTRMHVREDGTYGSQVEGLPIEGEQKLVALRAFADGKFGPGNWVIEYAYGDHYSDRTLLEQANHPCAVSPDTTLARHAKEQGWSILTW